MSRTRRTASGRYIRRPRLLSVVVARSRQAAKECLRRRLRSGMLRGEPTVVVGEPTVSYLAVLQQVGDRTVRKQAIEVRCDGLPIKEELEQGFATRAGCK